MMVRRCRAALESIRDSADPGLTQEEQSELLSMGLVRSVSHDERRSMERSVKEIDTFANRARGMTRRLDSAHTSRVKWESGSGGRGQKEDNREELRSTLERLEELVRQKTMLDALVFNHQTNASLMMTLDGRKTLEDLAAWEARFGDIQVSDFLRKMAAIRAQMTGSVRKASRTVKSFASPEPGFIVPELRGPALMMAEQGVDSERLATLMARTPGSYNSDLTVDRADMMLEATLLASSQGGAEAVLDRYKQTQRTLRDRDMLSDDDGVKTLSLMNMPSSESETRLERMNWIRTNMVVPNSTDVAWLASSRYPLEEVRARYDSIMHHLTSSQFQEDSRLRSACAIMAGSSHSVEEVTGRFSRIAAELIGMIEGPEVAGAMLASGVLGPDEAIHVFKEAIGVVSRESYFDDAQEIEDLALLLTRRLDPDVVPSALAGVERQAAAPPYVHGEDSDRSDRREIPWHYWYYWTHRYYVHRTMFIIRSHPGHMHTVPYFG